MKKIRDWLLKDWWLKLISIFLAIVIWFIWIQIENPTMPKDFSNIKVSIVNESVLNPDKKVWEILNNSDTVRVTVMAPKTVINSLTSDDIIAEADASKMVDNEIPITVRLAGDVTYDSITPNHDTVTLDIEDRERHYVRIMRNVYGEVAENYKYGGVSMDLNMIEISGPRSVIEQVSYGQVDINIDGISESLSANIEIELYDSGNNLITTPLITKQSDYVHVEVKVLETKTVPIYASKQGEPASGYLYARNLEVTPSVITLAGTAANLQGIGRINITEPIDISGAEGDVEATVDITPYIPDNLVFADDDFDGLVTVKIFVEQEESKKISYTSSDISIINEPSGWKFEMDEAAYVAELKGLESDLNALVDENISKVIDVSEWMDNNEMKEMAEGIYYMPVTLGLSSSVKVVNAPKVRVTVTKVAE